MNRKQFITALLLGLAAILIQGCVFKILAADILVPNLVLLVVVYLAFLEPSTGGAFLAFILGLEFDLASGVLLGPWAGAFVLVYGLLVVLLERVLADSPVVIPLAALFGSLVGTITYLLLFFELDLEPVGGQLWRVCKVTLLTALLAPLAFRILQYVLPSGDRRYRVKTRL